MSEKRIKNHRVVYDQLYANSSEKHALIMQTICHDEERKEEIHAEQLKQEKIKKQILEMKLQFLGQNGHESFQ